MRLRDLSIEHKFILVLLPVCLIPGVVFITLAIEGSRLAHEQAMGGELVKQSVLFAERFDNFLKSQFSTARTDLQDYDAAVDEESKKIALESMARDGLGDALAFINPRGEDRVEILVPSSETARLIDRIDLKSLHEWFNVPPPPSGGALFDRKISVPGRVDPFRAVMIVLPAPNGEIAVFIGTADNFIGQFTLHLLVAPDFFLVYSSNEYLIYGARGLSDDSVNQLDRMARTSNSADEWYRLRLGSRPYLFSPAASTFLKLQKDDWPPCSVWNLYLTSDLENYLVPQDRLVWLLVLVGLALTLALLGLAWLMARLIVRPLQVLKLQAGRLALGDLEVRAPSVSRDEVGELAEAFNSMAGRLQKTYRELETRLEEIRLRNEHINAINEIAHACLRAQEIDAIFENLQRDLMPMIPFDALWIARFEGGNADLCLMQAQPHELSAMLKNGRIPIAGSLHGAVIESEETVHAEIGPDQRHEFFESRAFAGEGYQSWLIAPLSSRQGVIGALGAASRSPDAFNANLAEVLTSVAGAVSIALEQNEVFRQLSQFAEELERKVEERTRQLNQARLKLTQTEKYFALGRLAGNLAHEINNPLGIIKNYLELVKSTLNRAGGGRRASDPNMEHVQIINEEVDRIAKLVRKLLDLHRPSEQSVQQVDVNRLVEDVLALLEKSMSGQGIRIERRLSPEAGSPVASIDLLRQVLINLIRNAQDAMEEGGVMTVETAPIVLKGEEAIAIRVSDTGGGIDPQDLNQIFDPFFTTKPAEKGTGLGLSVSFGIVQHYRGTIDVESQPGKGTTMTVRLPLDRTESFDEAKA